MSDADIETARSRDLFDAIRSRKSVRSFRTDEIDRNLIFKAIEAAGWAPSPHGIQPWRFVIIEMPADRYRLAAAMANAWRVQLRFDSEDESIVERRVRRSRERLERAPIVVVFCLTQEDVRQYPDPYRQQAETTMAIQSVGAAAQNFLLALHALGLDAGWMCAPLFCPEVVRGTLGLPPEMEPQALFPVGMMDRPPKRRERRDPADLVVPIGRSDDTHRENR